MNHLHINNLWINGLLRAFAQQGLDVDNLGRGLEGFSDGQLQPGHQLDLVSARTLWLRAVEQSGDPLLGVKIGLEQNPRSTGVLLPIILHSPSVRAALDHIMNFQTLISESGYFRLHEKRDADTNWIEYEYVPVPSSVAISPQQIISVVASTLVMLRTISDGDICPRTLYVPPEMDAPKIAEALQCHVENRDGNLCIAIPAEHLDDSISGRDEHLYQLSLSYAEGLQRAKRAGMHFLDRIKNCIDVETPALVSIDDVTENLGIHKRALQRNLREQGTSFRQIKESLLKERTLEMLIAERLDVEHIAQLLGYSDSSTFHRAFKTWFDATPKQFRERIGS